MPPSGELEYVFFGPGHQLKSVSVVTLESEDQFPAWRKAVHHGHVLDSFLVVGNSGMVSRHGVEWFHKSVFRKPAGGDPVSHLLVPTLYFPDVDLGKSAPHRGRLSSGLVDNAIHIRTSVSAGLPNSYQFFALNLWARWRI